MKRKTEVRKIKKPQIRHTMHVRLDFDTAALTIEDEAQFIQAMRREMEYTWDDNGQCTNSGWGMNRSRVIGIRLFAVAHEPQRRLRSMLAKIGFSGATFPDEPVHGRFILRGKILEGLKPAVGRPIEVHLTHDKAARLAEDLTRWIEKYPNTGTNPVKEKDDDNDW